MSATSADVADPSAAAATATPLFLGTLTECMIVPLAAIKTAAWGETKKEGGWGGGDRENEEGDWGGGECGEDKI